MDDSLIAVRDVGMLGRGDAPRGMLREGCFARDASRGTRKIRYVAASPRRPFAASPLRRVAPSPRRPFAASPLRLVTPSPRRPFAASPLRLVTLLVILFASSGCAAPVRVEWSTETEMNTAGFNLYRSESADGPFDVKVNEQIIPPAADPITGGNYQYVDKTAQPGVTYYYKLEEVEKSGGTNSFGPISVRAGGLAWWHVLVLVALAGVAVALWLLGGRKDGAGKRLTSKRPD